MTLAAAEHGSTPSERLSINSTHVEVVLSGAKAYGYAIGKAFNIAVTDRSGFLAGFLRMDNAFLASNEISIDKARTVALSSGKWMTRELYNATQPGGDLYGMLTTNTQLISFPSGVPIFTDGHSIGAVGTLGNTIETDEECASAGALAVGTLTA